MTSLPRAASAALLFAAVVVAGGLHPRLARADEPTATLPPAPPAKNGMPLTGLTQAKPMYDACVYRYPVGTTSKECQAFVDQGLGMYYSYVWIEAARAFETALRFDPDCAYAWLMLYRSLAPDKYGRSGPAVSAGPYQAAIGNAVFAKLPDRVGKTAREYALEMAKQRMGKANHREQLHIQSQLQEVGMWPGVGPDERKKKAQQTLDELLTLYDDDEEGWFWRAQLAKGDGTNAAAPFYKALLKVNPLHPGANHELVHFYEAIKRPALGWPFAENYIKSSPGIPHAFHMQAHLAMRIGKWNTTTDWSWKAVELQKVYHQLQGVKPNEDHQFNHHMETLTRSLIHDGRYAEATMIKVEATGYGYNFRPEWFKMALGQKDWAEANKFVEFFRKSDKAGGAYYGALLALEQGDDARLAAEVETLRQVSQTRKGNKSLELRLWEVQGRHLCRTGDGEAGLKLLKRAVDATKADFTHHAWGNGAVYMEAWGTGALECGNAAEAEEAFQEALAHDAGSIRGALGLWALCDRLGRTDEAERYLKVARRVWGKATVRDFEVLKADFAAKATKVSKGGGAVAGSGEQPGTPER